MARKMQAAHSVDLISLVPVFVGFVQEADGLVDAKVVDEDVDFWYLFSFPSSLRWGSRKGGESLLAKATQFGGTPIVDFSRPFRVGQ